MSDVTSELGELKRQLQDHFTDGLVTIVGSGLSCAEGIPGVQGLAAHLIAQMPSKVPAHKKDEWEKLSENIGKAGLEPALMAASVSSEVEDAIISLTSELIEGHERAIIEDVFAGARTLRLTKLLQHYLRDGNEIPVITTNYDRLIEVAAEEAGLGVDTMFVGNFAGALNPKEAKLSFCRDVRVGANKAFQFKYRERVAVFKPHGSLSWYSRNGLPVQYEGLISNPKLIITPGVKKFRSGYESPFDIHREKANAAIDRASRFLIIGYGFNDDHLETHLSRRIADGCPTVLLTYELTENAQKQIDKSPNLTALVFDEAAGKQGTSIVRHDRRLFIADFHSWDVGNFSKEVFNA